MVMSKKVMMGSLLALALPASIALAHDNGGRGDRDDDIPIIATMTTIHACMQSNSGNLRIVSTPP